MISRTPFTADGTAFVTVDVAADEQVVVVANDASSRIRAEWKLADGGGSVLGGTGYGSVRGGVYAAGRYVVIVREGGPGVVIVAAPAPDPV